MKDRLRDEIGRGIEHLARDDVALVALLERQRAVGNRRVQVEYQPGAV